MRSHWQSLVTAFSLLALLAVGTATPTRAAPPAGLTIGGAAPVCRVRAGGHDGFRVDWEFTWHLAEGSAAGSSVTLEGAYSVQVHDPENDQYETLVAEPYGFVLQTGSVERRGKRRATGDPHYVFDRVKLEVSWQIVGTELSGTETTLVDCEIQPPPPGEQPVTAASMGALRTAEEQKEAGDEEIFVHEADPSPYSSLVVDSALYCEEKRRGQEVAWALILNNLGLGGRDGAVVAGHLKVYTRTDDGAYELRHETPFGQAIMPNEVKAVDGYFMAEDQEAARLEVEWRASVGEVIQPDASTQKILRTTECE